MLLMGVHWFRQGKEYTSGQLGNAEALGLGLFPVEEAKQSKRKRLTVRISSLNTA